MKIRILLTLAAALFAGNAMAENACTGSATATTITGDSTEFIVEDFSMKCSNNVQLDWTQDSTQAAVCANSKKGINNFGGSTEGGSVTKKGEGCTGSKGACTMPTAVLNTGC